MGDHIFYHYSLFVTAVNTSVQLSIIQLPRLNFFNTKISLRY